MKNAKLFLILLALILVMSLAFSLTACEKDHSVIYDNPTEGLEFEYSAGNVGYAVAGIGSATDTDIVIPSQYKNMDVVEIRKEAFKGNTNITSVSVPSTVVEFGDNCFEGCTNLQTLNIPFVGKHKTDKNKLKPSSFLGHLFGGAGLLTIDALEDMDGLIDTMAGIFSKLSLKTVRVTADDNVGIGAFACCTTLEEVELCDGISEIGYAAFMYCSSLKKLTIGNVPSPIEVGIEAFAACGELSEVYLPNLETWFNLKFSEIGSHPLHSKGGNLYVNGNILSDIEVPTQISTIGDYQLAGLTNLKSVTTHENVQSFGVNAFENCTNLENVYISSGVTEIDSTTFSGCPNLTLTVDTNNPTFAMKERNLVNVKTKTLLWAGANGGIPSDGSVETIANSSFDDWTALTPLVIPNGVTTIESGAFSRCKGLTSVTIPGTVKLVDAGTFSMSSITEVILEEGVTTIEMMAFYGCMNLTKVSIPSTIKCIERRAFDFTSISYNSYGGGLYLGNESNPYVALVKNSADDENTTVTVHKDTTLIAVEALKGYGDITDILFENPNGWTVDTGEGVVSLNLTDSKANVQILGEEYLYYCIVRG